MKYKIFAIRDRAADCFGQPLYAPNTGTVVRSFSDQVNAAQKDNQFAQHPEDYDLFELGVYDDAGAEFELLEKPRQIAVGKDLVRN